MAFCLRSFSSRFRLRARLASVCLRFSRASQTSSSFSSGGLPEREVRYTVETFQTMDRRRLYEDYKNYTDIEKLRNSAQSYAQELEELFANDDAEHTKRPEDASKAASKA